jgi:hypothetical protein
MTPLTMDTVKQSIAKAIASKIISNKLISQLSCSNADAKVRIIEENIAIQFAYFDENMYFCSKIAKK